MKTKCKRLIVLIIFLLFSVVLFPQDFTYFTKFSGPYFGIKTPDKSPLKFEIKGYYQFFNDGTECYFESNGLWYSKLENGKWIYPIKLNIDYGKYTDFERNPSPSGDKILFNSIDRKIPEGTIEYWCPIWASKRDGENWSTPKYLEVGGMYPTISNNGTIYFTIDKDNSSFIAKSDLVNRKYSKYKLLPEPINSSESKDAHPYIAPDESFLIFDSDGRKMKNECNLFISFRKENGTWSEPINMGQYINQGGGAALAYVTPDGKYIFYRTNAGRIYWISASIIEDLKLSH